MRINLILNQFLSLKFMEYCQPCVCRQLLSRFILIRKVKTILSTTECEYASAQNGRKGKLRHILFVNLNCNMSQLYCKLSY